jgi:DNA (cytosine-5)-methyltransferase 1
VNQLSIGLTRRHRPVKGSTTPEGHAHVVAGLFAGVGGLERGLQRAGHETALLCENDPAAVAVLRAGFQDVPFHRDVRTLGSLPEETTLLAAGFPCQDLSQAGRTTGIAGARSGLIGEVFRLIEEHLTPWVLLENVPFMLQLGRGEAMNLITTTLEALRYRWAYRVIDTRSFGLPQRRRRVYLIASLNADPRNILFADEAGPIETPVLNGHRVACGFYWTEGTRGLGWAVDAIPTLKGGSSLGIPSSPAMLMANGEIATPDIRDAERLQGFPANWTRPAQAVTKKGHRWKLVGNAVTVPAAAWIGRRLRTPGRLLDFDTVQLEDHTNWPTAAWNVGEGRVRVFASEWPVRRQHRPLEPFLRFPTAPLSAKATAGFLGRAEAAKLRFAHGFLDAIRAHLERMGGHPSRESAMSRDESSMSNVA